MITETLFVVEIVSLEVRKNSIEAPTDSAMIATISAKNSCFILLTPSTYLKRIMSEQSITEVDMRKRLSTLLIEDPAFAAMKKDDFRQFSEACERPIREELKRKISEPTDIAYRTDKLDELVL